MLRLALGYILAVAVCYALGVACITQGNLAAVAALGMDTSLRHLGAAYLHDLQQMQSLYLPLVAAALLIGFAVAALIIRVAPELRALGYATAGLVALIALPLTLNAVFGITALAPTRTLTGLLAQGSCGLLAGLAFHRLTRPRSPHLELPLR